jgi:hypothetical protein
MLIVGRVHARLLRLPLLDIDVDVVVGPPDAVPRSFPRRRKAGRWRRTGARRPAPSAPMAAERGRGGRRPRSNGAGLALSVQLVEEATTVLDEVDGH